MNADARTVSKLRQLVDKLIEANEILLEYDGISAREMVRQALADLKAFLEAQP